MQLSSGSESQGALGCSLQPARPPCLNWEQRHHRVQPEVHAARTQTLQIWAQASGPGAVTPRKELGPLPGHHARLPQSPGKTQGPEDQRTLQAAWARPPS